MSDPTQYDKPHPVTARVEVNLIMQEMSVGGAILDAQGVAAFIRDHLASIPVCQGDAPQIKVESVEVATKDWEIAAQLRFQNDWGSNE